MYTKSMIIIVILCRIILASFQTYLYVIKEIGAF